MRKLVFLFLLIFGFFGSGSAQDYLGNDLAFFQKKARFYQHWLEEKGLAEHLKVDSIHLAKKGMELELFLSIKSTDPDTAHSIWSSLQKNFQQNNSGKTLEQTFFSTFVRMMEIPAIQGNVQIYCPLENHIGYNERFYAWIWEEEGELKLNEVYDPAKAIPIEILINVPITKQVAISSEIILYRKDGIHKVFDKVYAFTKNKFKSKDTTGNVIVSEPEKRGYILTFNVAGLQGEVLKDTPKSLWCWFWETWDLSCSTLKQERLEFKFSFLPLVAGGGYELHGEVTGKFGSGKYQPRDLKYMDMEPDFEDQLKVYVEAFNKELEKSLKGETETIKPSSPESPPAIKVNQKPEKQ